MNCAEMCEVAMTCHADSITRHFWRKEVADAAKHLVRAFANDRDGGECKSGSVQDASERRLGS
jgi:hypothetical protein